MALVPLGVSLSTKYELVGPDGEIATFNDPTDANFVGYITEPTGLDSAEVRDNGENLSGQDGGVHGPFFYGRRPITITGKMFNFVSADDRNRKITKLQQATNAMRKDAILRWTPAGGEAVYVTVRRQQPLRVTGDWEKQFQIQLVSADPRIYSEAESSGTVTFAESEVLAAGGTKQAAGAALLNGKFLYVPNFASNNLTIYSRNEVTGTLTKLENVATGTGPYHIIISPDSKHLYVINKTANTISKFSINESTGKLTAIGVALALGTEPMKGAITKDGKYIYVPNKGSNNISVLECEVSTGVLTLKETSAILPAATGPTCLVCVENNNTEAGYAMVIVGGYTSSRVVGLERKSNGVLAVPALTEAQRIVKAQLGLGSSSAFAEKILDLDMVEEYFVHSGTNYNDHSLMAIGETGVLGTVGMSSGSQGSNILKPGNGYGGIAFEAASKPNFLAMYSGENANVTLAGQGRLHLIGGSFGPGGSTFSLGAAAINNMGKPIIVGRDIYVPAADKIFEYRLGESTGTFTFSPTLQKFQNKAALVSCTNSGSGETFAKITLKVTAGQELINPLIINQTTGQVFAFSTTFKENDVVEVDMLNRAVKLNGKNAFYTVNLSGSVWFPLVPGVNELLVSSEKTVGSPKLTVSWHSAWV